MPWSAERPRVAPRGWWIAGLALLLASCGDGADRPGKHAAVKRPRGPASDLPVKIGKPYQVAGQWYWPADKRDYDEVGLASWYGPQFHAAATANGEFYDMNWVTAAHKTLPLPSYAEVTAIDSGKRVVVRVNDRGPFVADRIIDLSRGAARLLGMENQGVIKVRVRRIDPSESEKRALRSGKAADPLPALSGSQLAVLRDRYAGRTLVMARAAPAPAPTLPPPLSTVAPVATPVQSAMSTVMPATMPTTAAPAPVVPTPVVPAPVVPISGGYLIQVAALADADRADALLVELRRMGPSEMMLSGPLWRVRMGPFGDAAAADAMLLRLRAAGYRDAHIVRALR